MLLGTQRAIREFLKVRTSYDVLPLSFRLVVLDIDLLIKKSLNILLQNGTAKHPPKVPKFPSPRQGTSLVPSKTARRRAQLTEAQASFLPLSGTPGTLPLPAFSRAPTI